LVRLHERLSPVVAILTGIGALLVLVECLWISYGVFARYILRNPDDMVTEATALLLMPLAYAGLAYSLQHEAFPTVTVLVDRLPPRARGIVDGFNLLLMVLLGGFFTLVAGSAAFRSYQSGAASQIIAWPVWIFWVPVALCTGVFAAYGFLKLLDQLAGASRERDAG
jgi:TRAP-type C4-dicarboxylate transport system permease small subunit